jgi:hypothetical protein
MEKQGSPTREQLEAEGVSPEVALYVTEKDDDKTAFQGKKI